MTRKQNADTTASTTDSTVYEVTQEVAETEENFADEKSDTDPWEGFNRAVYRFNGVFDKAISKPVAKGYIKVTNKPVRKGVSNFFSNLGEPTTIINDVLQGKLKQGVKDTARFLFNSTVGLLGIFDVAKRINLKKHDEDFGQTFGKWGAGTGPYLVLPIFGPSNLRDGIGSVPGFYTDLTPHIGGGSTAPVLLRAASIVDSRSELLHLEPLLEQQIDSYVLVREGYLQSRLKAVHDGKPPVAADEFLDEELLIE